MVERPKAGTGAPVPRDRVVVTDAALATIIGLAAHEVPGVVGMAPASIREGLNRMLGASRADEGVEVDRDDDESRASIELHVVVAYGVNIPVVASSVRERVRYAAQAFAGVKVTEVKVHIAGVSRG
ncbi:MAG: Asp23/Gls24 family envelope stress response protein [Trueperaceae bacterium]